MAETLRLAISGAGRVFERLYLPALRHFPEVTLAAIAEPASERRDAALPGVPGFSTLNELLEGAAVDAVIELSPPARHANDALLALSRGLPVLVEKPLCADERELESLRSAGASGLVTPAFSRRYWPAYRRLGAHGPIHDLRVAIAVDPAGWGAYSGVADVADDLFPHVADLARWLTGAEIATVSGRRGTRGIEAELEMEGGSRVSTRLDARSAYHEAARADGRGVLVGPPRPADSLVRRVLRRDDPAIEAVREMLRGWVSALRGASPPRLPSFEDGAASVSAMEQLRRALDH